MKLRTLLLCALSASCAAAGADERRDANQTEGPPMLGRHWAHDDGGARAKEAHNSLSRTGTNPNMTYHGGPVITTPVIKAIFWGTSWATDTSDKLSGIDAWYMAHGTSTYAATVDEYGGSNGQVTSATTYQGHIIDSTAAQRGTTTTPIAAEVCKEVNAGNIVVDPAGNGYYPVYTDLPRGNAGFCAWHSVTSCSASGGVAVQIAFFFKLDGDAGCDPQDTSGKHSQGLAALANVTAHELSEARSDPAAVGAWYDRSGNENGDKCAWTFGAALIPFPAVPSANVPATSWKLQGEWSNKAYTAGTGYPNASGQKGCLSGL